MSDSLVTKWREKNTLSRLKSGDKEAFIRAYDDFADDLYRFAFFKLGSEEDAKDLVSVIFLKAWNYIQTNSLKDAKTLRALLYRIARNAIIDHYRDKGLASEISLEDAPQALELPDDSQNQEELLDKKTDLGLIQEKMMLLKDEYREVIIWRFIEDLSLDEIANITEKKKGNVRVLLHRAISALKDLVNEESPQETKAEKEL
ncbi:MAG: sigma-70 family RNA polymerase sigma factor [Candidatus Falkowbacteria bacterium]|nr:sigma-70 family RNA polymerase sigma factor [Candidatus Falkowbacteria bacterium]